MNRSRWHEAAGFNPASGMSWLRLLREGGNHSIYVNRAVKKVSAVPRHREVIEFTARKICKDLEIPRP